MGRAVANTAPACVYRTTAGGDQALLCSWLTQITDCVECFATATQLSAAHTHNIRGQSNLTNTKRASRLNAYIVEML